MNAVKYPLACGCAGSKFISMCTQHQIEQIDSDRRAKGLTVLELEKELTELEKSIVEIQSDVKSVLELLAGCDKLLTDLTKCFDEEETELEDIRAMRSRIRNIPGVSNAEERRDSEPDKLPEQSGG